MDKPSSNNDNLNDCSDSALIKLIADGSHAAFDEIVVRYQKRIFVNALNIVQLESLAMEVVQEVFFQLYYKVANYDPARGEPGAYIWKITQNICYMLLRREKNHLTLDFVDTNKFANETFEENMDEFLLNGERATALDVALCQLPDIESEILRDYFYRDKSLVEIAEAKKLSINTVNSHAFRAKEKLRKILGKSIW